MVFAMFPFLASKGELAVGQAFKKKKEKKQ
jgi:hypothetical protein